MRNHSIDRKFICSYCQKGFTQAANLRNHERIHRNERYDWITHIVCCVNFLKFLFNSIIEGHTYAMSAEKHSLKLQIWIIIRGCIPARWVSYQSFCVPFQQNIYRPIFLFFFSFSFFQRPFVCIEANCGRSFAQVTNLNNHMKTHHKIQQYVCNQCPKKFTQVRQSVLILSTLLSKSFRLSTFY